MKRINICEHRHLRMSRPLPELPSLWTANFTVTVRSLATRKKRSCAASKRAYAGLYYERLSF